MESTEQNIFQTTFEGLENGLSVQHIATFTLKHCNPQDSIEDVLKNPKWEGIDCIPVLDSDSITGVIERKSVLGNGVVKNQMRRLSEEILVASRMPLKEFLPRLKNPPFYRLVLRGTKVEGIVTRSDVQKLPVRIMAFGVITHLEMSMAKLITQTYDSDEEWVRFLSHGRQIKLEGTFQELKKNRLDITKLEATQFCDKRSILRRILNLNTNQRKDLKDIEEIRDTVSHAGNYADSEDDLMKFLALLETTEFWIQEIESKYPPVLSLKVDSDAP